MTSVDLDAAFGDHPTVGDITWEPVDAATWLGTSDELVYLATHGTGIGDAPSDGVWLCRVLDEPAGRLVAVFSAHDIDGIRAGAETKHQDYVCRMELLKTRIAQAMTG